MKNIILVTAASTLLLASGAWAGIAGGPPFPMIDLELNECYVWEQDAVLEDRAVYVVNPNIRANHRIDKKTGVEKITATCSGKQPDLLTGEDFNKPIHIDVVDINMPCAVVFYDGEWFPESAEWEQVLRSNGGFSLKCTSVREPGPP